MDDLRYQRAQALVTAAARLAVAETKADDAFNRWFAKRQAGEPTNAAQATRLSNEANYRSADYACAQVAYWGPYHPDESDEERVLELAFEDVRAGAAERAAAGERA